MKKEKILQNGYLLNLILFEIRNNSYKVFKIAANSGKRTLLKGEGEGGIVLF